MSRFRECPSCRALLTEDQLNSSQGTCPYCDARVGAPGEYADPDAAPTVRRRRPLAPLEVPYTLGGKLLLSFQLLFEQMPLIAALVLMIKLPSNVAIELIAEKHANPADPFGALWLVALVELFFGPIYAAGIVTMLANRMSGHATSFRDATKVGVDKWATLFAARIVANVYIFCGLLAFIIPGIVLAIRYSLIDEVVVLENATVADSRHRSAALVRGKGFTIFQAGLVSRLIIVAFASVVARLAGDAGLIGDPVARACFDCLINVFAISFSILLFLYYWEAQTEWKEAALSNSYETAVQEHES